MDWEQKTIVNELTQGKELAEQLRHDLSSISSPEMRQDLVEQILSSYEKVLSILKWGACATETKPIISPLESPHSYANSSPRSEVSDQGGKDQCHKDVYKKRKTQPRWTQQVKVCSGSGMEGPLDDGYNWRKYGQKDILGANFPRGYYRCTHRHSQGCLATKQVQRSDQDPTIFEVTYRGRHTCFQSSRLPKEESAPQVNDKAKQNTDNCQLQEVEEKPKLLKEISFNYREGLKIEDLETTHVGEIFPSIFSFPDASSYNDIFKDTMIEDNLLGSLRSPVFISPATSESNYFSVSPCNANPESDSVPTSVTNSPIGDWDIDISLENVDFEASFPLEDPDDHQQLLHI